MSSPDVPVTIGDNQLGIRAPVDATLVIIATAEDGDVGVPKAFTRTEDVVTEYAAGRLVEGAAYAIEHFGLNTLLIRADGSTPGELGSLNTDEFEGTTTPSLEGSVEPNDDYEPYVVFVSGGTTGTAGIKYRTSLDGGRTLAAPKSLGAALFLTFPGSGMSADIRINFTTGGTIVEGDILSTTTVGPDMTSTDLDDALEALRLSSRPWTILGIVGDLDADMIAVIDAKAEALHLDGVERRCIGNIRKPAQSEDEGDYLIAAEAEFSESSCRRLVNCYGWTKTTSSVSGRRYRRPLSLSVMALAASVSEEIDLAEIAYGPLPGVSIRDAHGNPDEHDETIFPGADDLRFCTARTWKGRTGVYVNNPRLFSPVGSDFLYLQHGRVLDLCVEITKRTLEPILNKGVFVLPDGTGRIEAESATTIEGQVNGELNREVTSARKATKVTFTLDRQADVLRTGKLPWSLREIPLAYIKSMPGTAALVASDASPATVIG